MRIVWIAMLCVISVAADAQSLDGHIGAGISYDGFMPNKEITKLPAKHAWRLNPQFVLGLRYKTEQNFNLMLDATLGTSSINFPAPGDEKIDYNEVRSLITIGSGLYMPVANDQSVMPFIQLGTGFFDFQSIRSHNTGYYYSSTDYNTRHWEIVVGAGIEYGFKWFLPSTINLRVLYTPLDIFPEPIKYYMEVQGKQTEYELQGKLVQCLLTYQMHLPIAKWTKGY